MPGANSSRAPVGIVSFPAVNGANPYQRLLYDHLADQGLVLQHGAEFKLTWLWRNRRNVSVIHFHWPQTYYLWDGSPVVLRRLFSWAKLSLFALRLSISRALGYRIAWTVHQVTPHEELGALLDILASRMLAWNSCVLVAHDEETATTARERLGRAGSSIHVIPHGSYIGVYPEGRGREEMRRDIGVSNSDVVFLYFGQIRGYKDLATLLAAFAETSGDERLRLVIAGSPIDEDSAAIVRNAAQRDPRLVARLGFVPPEAVAELFGAADAIVLPRADGGTSGSLILALSLGRPAVVADVRTYVELIGGACAGWTFRAGNERSLAATLQAAAASPDDVIARGVAAREIAAGLRWPETAAEVASLMFRALRRPRATSDVLLVCSAGGHLLQMLALQPAWEGMSRCWVTLERSDATSLLVDEHVVYAHGPTHRSIANLLRNLCLAWKVITAARPRLILTTGAAVAVPFAWVGRLRGVRVVYIESITRIDRPSLSCRLIAPTASRVYGQWPEFSRALPRARFAGAVISSR